MYRYIYVCVYTLRAPYFIQFFLENIILYILIKIYNIVNHIIFIGPLCDAVFYNILLRMFCSEIQEFKIV